MADNFPKKYSDVFQDTLSEAYNFETITIAAAQTDALAIGTLLGKITASGLYVRYDSGAADGSETIAGVLAEAVAAGTADRTSLALTYGPAVVKSTGLVHTDGADAATIAAEQLAVWTQLKVRVAVTG